MLYFFQDNLAFQSWFFLSSRFAYETPFHSLPRELYYKAWIRWICMSLSCCRLRNFLSLWIANFLRGECRKLLLMLQHHHLLISFRFTVITGFSWLDRFFFSDFFELHVILSSKWTGMMKWKIDSFHVAFLSVLYVCKRNQNLKKNLCQNGFQKFNFFKNSKFCKIIAKKLD